MLIKDRIDTHIATMQPHATVTEAISVMINTDTHAVVVYDGMKIYGIISDWDMAARSLMEKWDEQHTVLESVARRLPYCLDDDSDEDVAFIMWLNQIDQLLVLDSTSRPLGLITSRQLWNIRCGH